eukprot:1152009-Pelagomonas_calceolata.AAC.5
MPCCSLYLTARTVHLGLFIVCVRQYEQYFLCQVSDGRPSYIVVNADESEPGTCKVALVPPLGPVLAKPRSAQLPHPGLLVSEPSLYANGLLAGARANRSAGTTIMDSSSVMVTTCKNCAEPQA